MLGSPHCFRPAVDFGQCLQTRPPAITSWLVCPQIGPRNAKWMRDDEFDICGDNAPVRGEAMEIRSWVFLEWGHQSQHRTTNVGPFKRNMISNFFFCEGETFLLRMPDQHDFPCPLWKWETFSSKMPDHPWNYFSDHLWKGFRKLRNVMKLM